MNIQILVAKILDSSWIQRMSFEKTRNHKCFMVIFPYANLGAWMDGEVLEGSDLRVVPAAVPCPVHGEYVIGEDLAEDEL
jgi:hypothetical protein